jgi:hypothetical protein
MAIVAVAASKPGAGPYHLMGFLPIVTQLGVAQAARSRRSDWSRPAIAALAGSVVLFLIVAAQQWTLITSVRELRGAETVADLRKFAAEHRGATIEVGYAADERLTFSRPVDVFLTGVYLLDQPAIQEHQLQGIPIPAATVDAIADCRVWFWLIPKGEEPFTARNRYPAMRGARLYSEQFRQTFFGTYRLVGHTSFFDVWECRERPAGATHR